MSLAKQSYQQLLITARNIGGIGIEVRNDLEGARFDGEAAGAAGGKARSFGLEILAVAEVKAYNDGSTRALDDAGALMQVAVECGARGIALIPRCDGHGCEPAERVKNLLQSIIELKPMLEAHKLVGFIEPLGFEQSSLRSKREVIDTIHDCDAGGQFLLVHDTFHHFLAGGGPLFPEHTGIVHVSGVIEADVEIASMRDEQRVLVDQRDRLQNISQLQSLRRQGYEGPVSMEAFAPLVHDFVDPEAELSGSFSYITSAVGA